MVVVKISIQESRTIRHILIFFVFILVLGAILSQIIMRLK
jgi:hypothetical protein